MAALHASSPCRWKPCGCSCIPGVMVKGKPFAGFPDSRESTFRRSFDVSNPHVQYYLRQGGILNLQTKTGIALSRAFTVPIPISTATGSGSSILNEVAQQALMLQDAGAKYLFITDSTFNCPHRP